MKRIVSKKKRWPVLLLVILCILLFVPIPVPMHKTLSGVAYRNDQIEDIETTSIEIDGIYWLRIIGKDEFRGNFMISTEPDTMSDTITVQISPLNSVTPTKMQKMFYYSELGQGYVKVKNAEFGYFLPFFGNVLLTSGSHIQEEGCCIIAAPADTYEEAQKLIEKLDAASF